MSNNNLAIIGLYKQVRMCRVVPLAPVFSGGNVSVRYSKAFIAYFLLHMTLRYDKKKKCIKMIGKLITHDRLGRPILRVGILRLI